MNTSACLSDTSLLVLTLQFRINTARIKALLIFPWVLTPYYLLNNSGPHHLLVYPSGSWFRYHFRLWTLSFELYWNLVDSSPVQYLKAFPIQPQSLNSSWFSTSHTSVTAVHHYLFFPLGCDITLKLSLGLLLPLPSVPFVCLLTLSNVSCFCSCGRSVIACLPSMLKMLTSIFSN